MPYDETMDRVKAVQDRYTAQILNKAHVVGVSIGRIGAYAKRRGRLALIVLVDRKFSAEESAPEDRIPDELDGVPVVVREVGSLQTMQPVPKSPRGGQ